MPFKFLLVLLSISLGSAISEARPSKFRNMQRSIEVGPALAMRGATNFDGKIAQKKTFCSSSLVEYNGGIYNVTANHCLDSNALQMFATAFMSGLDMRGRKFWGLGGSREPKESYGISMFLEAQQGALSRKGLEIMYVDLMSEAPVSEDFKNSVEAAWSVNRDSLKGGDSIVQDISYVFKTEPTHEVSSLLGYDPSVEIAQGLEVAVAGYPNGKPYSSRCEVVELEAFVEEFSQCIRDKKLDEDIISEITNGFSYIAAPDHYFALRCDREFLKSPQGLSGGPVYIGNNIVGVISHGPTDHRTLLKIFERTLFLSKAAAKSLPAFEVAKKCYGSVNDIAIAAKLKPEQFVTSEEVIGE